MYEGWIPFHEDGSIWSYYSGRKPAPTNPLPNFQDTIEPEYPQYYGDKTKPYHQRLIHWKYNRKFPYRLFVLGHSKYRSASYINLTRNNTAKPEQRDFLMTVDEYLRITKAGLNNKDVIEGDFYFERRGSNYRIYLDR